MDCPAKEMETDPNTYSSYSVVDSRIDAFANLTNRLRFQQSRLVSSIMGAAKSHLKPHISFGKVAWGLLAEDGIEFKGHLQKLATFLQNRYAIAYNEAKKLVTSRVTTRNSK